ncbi:hypothetical protein GCM10023066_14420 [Nocardioides kongjuensis]
MLSGEEAGGSDALEPVAGVGEPAPLGPVETAGLVVEVGAHRGAPEAVSPAGR